MSMQKFSIRRIAIKYDTNYGWKQQSLESITVKMTHPSPSTIWNQREGQTQQFTCRHNGNCVYQNGNWVSSAFTRPIGTPESNKEEVKKEVSNPEGSTGNSKSKKL